MPLKTVFASLAVIAAGGYAFATTGPAEKGREEIALNTPAATEIALAPGQEDEAREFGSYLTGEMENVLEIGDRPPLTDHLIFNRAGELFPLSDLKGKAMLINFWASWCAPCRYEMPALQRLQEAVGDEDFEVVAINVDRQGFEKAEEALEDWGVEGLTVYNDPTMKIAFDLAQGGALPTTYIVDKDGTFRALYIGPLEWDAPEAIELFTALKDGKI